LVLGEIGKFIDTKLHCNVGRNVLHWAARCLRVSTPAWHWRGSGVGRWCGWWWRHAAAFGRSISQGKATLR